METLNKIAQTLKDLNNTLKTKIEDGTYDFDDDTIFRFEMWEGMDGSIYLVSEGYWQDFENIEDFFMLAEKIKKDILEEKF